MKNNPLLFLFVLILSSGIRAAVYPDPGSMEFSHLTQKDGLSHNNVECIFKGSDGFLWFGTRNGLCRYDGYEFLIFRSNGNRSSLSGDRILSINEDLQGNMWIGTYSNGLNRYDRETETFSTYLLEENPGCRINKIAVFKNGQVWACTNTGLACYNAEKDSFEIFRMSPDKVNSLNSNVVHDILKTRKGEIFIATEADEIQQYLPATGEFKNIPYRRDPELTSNYKKRMIEGPDGVLWIAANVHGLSSYNPETGASAIYTQGEGTLTTNVLSGDLAVSPEGNIWICTDGGGINILDPRTGHFSYINKEDENRKSISSDHIICVYFDDKNIVWVGTFGDGVNYYDPARYKFNAYYKHPGDLDIFEGKSVLSVYEDADERLWIGTDGDGLYRFNPDGDSRHYTRNPANENSLSSNAITCLGEDNRGNILIGTYSGGLVSYDTKQKVFTRFNNQGTANSRIHSGNVWDILTDSKHRIWLGLLGEGVDLFDPVHSSFTSYGPSSERSDKIDFANIMAIMEDSDGDIWFGSEGRGIYILDNETGKILRIEADTMDRITTEGVIKCLYQDKWGSVWIGTEGKGLFRLKKNSHDLKSYKLKDGLPSNIIQFIREDAQENLWIGTSNGLALLNPKTDQFRIFIQEDGLSGNEFNRNAIIQMSDGRFVCGSTNGLDIFRPADIRINQNLPRIVFTKFEIMNQPVHPGDMLHNRIILEKSINYSERIELTHKEKFFSVEFTALIYTLPQKCVYNYKLEGYDETWITTNARNRRVSYYNLPPGNYVFKVRASNNDGKWGNNERSLMISILPPFYRTWWFRLVILFLGIAMVVILYRYRLNLHKKAFRQKQAEQDKKIMALEKEKLESELQKLTFHIINRNRVLINQKNRLLGLSVKAKESVKHGLEDIINIIDEDLNEDKDWKYIEPQLDKVYNNFVSRLKEKHPDLTVAEIKIAAYVRMNLSTKEISEFMHKTIRAVENDRYRLRKKIGLDSNDSLQHYLVNL